MKILGLAGGLGHDASACLMVDGRVSSLVEEERLVRRKYARDQIPLRSALTCLQMANLSMTDVDRVALAWDPSKDVTNPRMPTGWRQLMDSPELSTAITRGHKFYDHHLCHAASAYAFAGQPQSAVVLVMDGRGEDASTTVFHVDRGRYVRLGSSDLEASLGSLYAVGTAYCGLGDGGQGKLMAMASFGNATYDFPEFEVEGWQVTTKLRAPRGLGPTQAHRHVKQLWGDRFKEVFGPRRVSGRSLGPRLDFWPVNDFEMHHANAAASVQSAVERIVADLVRRCILEFPEEPVLLAGGVALNCSLAGRLRSSFPETDVRTFPVPHDSGTALGAALLASQEMEEPAEGALTAYLGKSWSDSDIADVLNDCGLTFIDPGNIGATVAERMIEGQVIGWFQGAAEVGPRALGHRSILASPFQGNQRERINSTIKHRELWRPFGPSVLVEDMPALFPVIRTPYMMEAALMYESKLPQFSDVVHVDGTSRPHSVDKADGVSPRYHEVLRSMKIQSGLGVALNTSFNGVNEPIVYTPLDAVKAFFGSPLDALAIGPFLLQKGRTIS